VDNYGFKNPLAGYRHPWAVLFHCLFKAAALLIYLFGGLITDTFVITFVLVVVFVSIDFWIVKNVSGRLLVGMRWWNEIKEDGSSEWIFESVEVK
jgi:hypothetical protein